MNRADRRRQAFNGMPKGQILQNYRKDAYDEGYKAGMRSVVEITLYMVAYTLSYKLEIPKEEIQQIIKAIYNNIDSYRTGQLSADDYDVIVEQMKTEYGVKIL